MRIPNQTFTSRDWTMYESLYQTARTDARIRAAKSFGKAATYVRARRFI
jgi:hypothetical protein